MSRLILFCGIWNTGFLQGVLSRKLRNEKHLTSFIILVPFLFGLKILERVVGVLLNESSPSSFRGNLFPCNNNYYLGCSNVGVFLCNFFKWANNTCCMVEDIGSGFNFCHWITWCWLWWVWSVSPSLGPMGVCMAPSWKVVQGLGPMESPKASTGKGKLVH